MGVVLLLCSLLTAHCSLGAEGGEGDKDLTILRLQKIIAEQTMTKLLENTNVAEYERIRRNYQRVLDEIAAKEKKLAESSKQEAVKEEE